MAASAHCERATFTAAAAAAANNRWLIVGSIDGDGDDDDGIGERKRSANKRHRENRGELGAIWPAKRAAAEVSEKKITQIDAADSITHTH